MKPVYKLSAMCWFVDGLGLFKSKEEAEQAIEDNRLKHTINIRISDKTKRQLTKLATDKNTNMSDYIRQLIEREVKDYGKEKKH